MVLDIFLKSFMVITNRVSKNTQQEHFDPKCLLTNVLFKGKEIS